MLKLLVSIFAVVAYCYACSWSGSTDLHVESCLDNKDVKVDLGSIQILPYPPSASAPFHLSYFIDNESGKRLDNLIDDFKIEWFGWWMFKCDFHTLSIPGTHDVEACSFSKDDCVIEPGRHLANTTLDLSKYGAIVSSLAKNKMYRITYTTKDADKNPILCFVAQFFVK